MTQTGGKKIVRRRTSKRKAPVRRTTKRRTVSRKTVKRSNARRTSSKPAKRRTVKRRVHRGGDRLAALHPGKLGRGLGVRYMNEQDLLQNQLASTNVGKAESDKRFIRSPLMDMPPHVQMDPMNDISAYLSDYYMNVDVEKLARQMYGAAVHDIYNTGPKARMNFVGRP